MKNNYKGPFFTKTDEGYVLSDICKNCAFGDEISCFLNPCMYLFAVAENAEEEDEEEEDE